MTTSTFQRSTWWRIGLNRFVNTEPCHRILLRDMNMPIKCTARIVGSPPITISKTCDGWWPFSIASSASKSECSISKPWLRVGRLSQPDAKSSLPVRIRLPLWDPPRMWSPNSWDPTTAIMESILTLYSTSSEHYFTIRKTQCTAWQYAAENRSVWIISFISRRIYWMNYCTQRSFLFTIVLCVMLKV